MNCRLIFFILIPLLHPSQVFALRCLSCNNNPGCSSGDFPGTTVSCANGNNSYCYVYQTFPSGSDQPKFMKGCLEYVDGGVGDPPNLAAAWPQDFHCVTILDGDNKGLPNGHGCKCQDETCNVGICEAANSHDRPSPPHLTYSDDGSITEEGTECKTINCQRCVFPFKYNDVEYNSCTTADSDNGSPWCAVDIEEDGNAVYGAWEDCDMNTCQSSSGISLKVNLCGVVLLVVSRILHRLIE